MIDETPTDSIDIWAPEWTYETDLLLAHVSGLKVEFHDPPNDPRSPQGRRLECKGDFLPGTVRTSREFFARQGMGEIEAVKSSMQLYRQAELLYRLRPAGTINAPKSQGSRASGQ